MTGSVGVGSGGGSGGGVGSGPGSMAARQPVRSVLTRPVRRLEAHSVRAPDPDRPVGAARRLPGSARSASRSRRPASTRIQWDVMDGVFVPTSPSGPDVIAACRPLVDVPFEAHLMVVRARCAAPRCVEAGCEVLIVHAEACRHLHRTLASIRDLGASPAVALNPATPVDTLRHVLDLVDEILVMTVNPGFGGQAYIDTMEPKIAEVRAMIEMSGRDIDLEVDAASGRPRSRGRWRRRQRARGRQLPVPRPRGPCARGERDPLDRHRRVRLSAADPDAGAVARRRNLAGPCWR